MSARPSRRTSLHVRDARRSLPRREMPRIMRDATTIEMPADLEASLLAALRAARGDARPRDEQHDASDGRFAMRTSSRHERHMRRCIELAPWRARRAIVPWVRWSSTIASSCPKASAACARNDATAHAEIEALRAAFAEALPRWRHAAVHECRAVCHVRIRQAGAHQSSFRRPVGRFE